MSVTSNAGGSPDDAAQSSAGLAIMTSRHKLRDVEALRVYYCCTETPKHEVDLLRRVLLAVAMMGCRPDSTSPSISADALVGRWSSITPGREFIALTITHGSFSSHMDPARPQGDLGARLTFSGVAWDGSGSIDGSAFRATMGPAGMPSPTRVLVVRVTSTDTLQAQFGDASEAEHLVLVRAK